MNQLFKSRKINTPNTSSITPFSYFIINRKRWSQLGCMLLWIPGKLTAAGFDINPPPEPDRT
jgi:hypothetical protein